MRLVLTALALTAWAVPLSAQQQTPPAPPGPLENLVPESTEDRAKLQLQIDLGLTAAWIKSMRQKYEGKFPGPAPRTPEGTPDLNGVWIARGTPERPALTPLGLTLLEHRYKTDLKDHPYAVCLPQEPVPGNGLWVVMQNRTQLVTLFEHPPNHRLVFLDGRPHPPDPDPTWMGHSVGQWDGDTLVVDSTGFNDKSWLFAALAHTANLRIRERWTRTTMGTMTMERTYEDPEMFLKPWKFVFELFLAPGEALLENICENNRFQGLTKGYNP